MKSSLLSHLAGGMVAALIPLSFAAPPRHNYGNPGVPAAVTTEWLSQNLHKPDLLVIDLRETAAYNQGHISGSLSVPFSYASVWARTSDEEILVMPPADELMNDLTAIGFRNNTSAVLVGDVANMPVQMARVTRTAATLKFAQFPMGNVGILSGGFAAWTAAGLEVSTSPTAPNPGAYSAETDASFIVDRQYVHGSLNKASEGTVLLDVRPPSVYKAGHIESALSIPLALIWTQGDAKFRSEAELQSSLNAVIGDLPVTKTSGEIIVYCYEGLLASGWFYTLTSVLGYQNVKLYDGSTSDWVKEYPLVPS